MTPLLDDPARDRALKDWIETIGRGRINNAARVSGGAYRASCRFTLDTANGERCVFAMIDLGSAPKTPFDLEREYQVLTALDGRGRAPHAIGYHADLRAMAMECIPGTADYSAFSETEKAGVERSFIEALAETHCIDIESLNAAHLPPGLTIREAIEADLDLWENVLISSVERAHPIALFALAWARARMPQDDRPAVLVQGDAGPGNFLCTTEGVTGVVDWEMTHLGHPLEDLGCIMARSLVQPTVASDRLLELYQEITDREWRREDLRYATLLVMARFSVPISLALEARDPAMDYGLTNSYFQLSLISILRLIAAAEGIALDETVPRHGTAPEIGFEFDYMRHVLSHIVLPTVEDSFIRYRLEGVMGMLGYVAEAVVPHDALPRQDLTAEIDRAARTIAAGGEALHSALQAMMTQALYIEHLMQPMLGPLHGRRIQP